MAQLLQHLLSQWEALSSIPIPAKKIKRQKNYRRFSVCPNYTTVVAGEQDAEGCSHLDKSLLLYFSLFLT
jgi:hypothetical protein